MASLCRWIGGGLLVVATVAFVFDRDQSRVVPGAVLAFVWLVAGQLASAIATGEKNRA